MKIASSNLGAMVDELTVVDAGGSATGLVYAGFVVAGCIADRLVLDICALTELNNSCC